MAGIQEGSIFQMSVRLTQFVAEFDTFYEIGLVLFHPSIGFLNVEQIEAKRQTGYIEQVRLKKPD
ncbi:MAG: hypothetical protein IPG86_16155 [Chitinophagaceae bacterium]|nr:hypothetical protein [Chitinophagaceae bacterium]